MPLLKTPAIVLKSRKWGDADRIVTFFTLKHGKVRGVARGARRMKSRFGGTLEPFVYCDLVLYEKPGDTLYRVSQTDVRQAFHPLRNSLETIAGAARLANLAGAVTADAREELAAGPGTSRPARAARSARHASSGSRRAVLPCRRPAWPSSARCSGWTRPDCLGSRPPRPCATSCMRSSNCTWTTWPVVGCHGRMGCWAKGASRRAQGGRVEWPLNDRHHTNGLPVLLRRRQPSRVVKSIAGRNLPCVILSVAKYLLQVTTRSFTSFRMTTF